jgi:hypothetical protein
MVDAFWWRSCPLSVHLESAVQVLDRSRAVPDAGRVVGYYSLQLPPPQLRNTNVETLSLALRVERNGAEKVALFSAKVCVDGYELIAG